MRHCVEESSVKIYGGDYVRWRGSGVLPMGLGRRYAVDDLNTNTPRRTAPGRHEDRCLPHTERQRLIELNW